MPGEKGQENLSGKCDQLYMESAPSYSSEELKDAEEMVVTEGHSCAGKIHPLKENCPKPPPPVSVQVTLVR